MRWCFTLSFADTLSFFGPDWETAAAAAAAAVAASAADACSCDLRLDLARCAFEEGSGSGAGSSRFLTLEASLYPAPVPSSLSLAASTWVDFKNAGPPASSAASSKSAAVGSTGLPFRPDSFLFGHEAGLCIEPSLSLLSEEYATSAISDEFHARFGFAWQPVGARVGSGMPDSGVVYLLSVGMGSAGCAVARVALVPGQGALYMCAPAPQHLHDDYNFQLPPHTNPITCRLAETCADHLLVEGSQSSGRLVGRAVVCRRRNTPCHTLSTGTLHLSMDGASVYREPDQGLVFHPAASAGHAPCPAFVDATAVCQGCGFSGGLVFMTGLGVKVCPMCAWAMPAQGAGPSVYLGAFHPTAGGLTIFLSYGHDGLTDVSRHLTRVLKKRGHSVWFDETSLTSGCDWAREMAAGLSNARAAGPRGRVIAMLAQHGFRRKDGMAQGYCHREVAEACQTMPQYLLPIMLEDMEPPACLRSMQAHFFDMRGVLTARASPPHPKSSPPWGGGGLTPEEWQAFLTRDPGMITAVNSIVSMLETGHFGPPLVPESLWCEMAAGTGAAAAGAGAAAAAEAAELEGAKEKPRIFISCDSKAAAVGQYIATYLHGADYEVAFDAEVASWGDERGQAFREVRRAYLKSAIFWTAGKTNSWGAYKARRDELLGAASAEARGGGGDPTPTGVSGSPLAADDADDTGAAVRQGSTKACEAPVTKPGKCLFIMTRDSVLRSEAPGSNKSGQCKDEFDLAFSKGISFIPLKAEECTAPLSIVGLQYLSLSRAVERDAAGALVVKEEAFAAVLPQILKGLTGSLASEGEQLVKSNRIRRGLQPCDYKAYLEQCLGRMFFPPPSCVSRAEEWLAAASARAKSVVAGSTSSASILRGASVMVVQGPVGTGKTAFVRHLADEWGAVRAQHIAAEGDDAKLSALRAISSIAYQLTRAFPSLTEMLLKDSFLEKRLPTLTARRWFKDLFIEKLQQAVVWEPLGEGKEPPLVIIMVDGVDLMVDADSEDKVNTFLECLMQFAEDMPANVAFLLTCRSTSYCDPHFGTLESLLERLHTKGAATSMLPMMDPAGASEREDCIRKYLRDALPKAVPPPAPMDGGGLALGSHGTPTPDPLSRQEQGSSLTRERRQSSVLAELGVGASSMFEADGPWASQVAKATDCIVQRSEGVFLYAVQIIRDLKSGTNLSLSRPEDFPWGLQNMHRVLLKQAFKPEDKLSETLSGKVLAVLGATREPMKLQQLAKILGTKLSDVDHAVSKLQPLLRYRDDGVVPAHGRVLPWFESPEAGRFKTFPAHGHTWIIQWCLTAIRSEESMKSMSVPTSYAVRHLEAHCGLAHDETVVAEARQLMKSKEFLQKYRTQLVGDQGMSAFYHDFPPKAGRERSEAILRGKPEGSFLMRNTSDDQLCISLQVNQNARLYTQHLKILPTVLPADSQELLRVFSQLRSKFDMLISQGWPPRATEGPLATEMAELLQHAAQETMYCTQPLLGILDEHRRLGLATVDEAFLSQFVFPNAVSLVQHYMEMGTLLWPVAPQAQVPQMDGGYTTASTMAEVRGSAFPPPVPGNPPGPPQAAAHSSHGSQFRADSEPQWVPTGPSAASSTYDAAYAPSHCPGSFPGQLPPPGAAAPAAAGMAPPAFMSTRSQGPGQSTRAPPAFASTRSQAPGQGMRSPPAFMSTRSQAPGQGTRGPPAFASTKSQAPGQGMQGQFGTGVQHHAHTAASTYDAGGFGQPLAAPGQGAPGGSIPWHGAGPAAPFGDQSSTQEDQPGSQSMFR